MTVAAETIRHGRYATTWDDEPREVRVAYDRLVQRRHGRFCPTHQVRLTGGPATFACEFGHKVRATDLGLEVTA